jgi:hypothetical protein
VNRQNLKIINFEHALHPGLGLEINNSEFGVWKIVLLTMSCSIIWITLRANSNQCEQENFRDREEGRNKSNGKDQYKWTWRFVFRGSVPKNLLPVEEATKSSLFQPFLSLNRSLRPAKCFFSILWVTKTRKDHHTIRCLLLALQIT